MSERPIIFTGESVRAILAGRKTQTRRVARFIPLPGEESTSFTFSGVSAGYYCTDVPASGHVLYVRRGGGTWHQITQPLHGYAPRDRLWVRETWAGLDELAGDVSRDPPQVVGYRADETAVVFGDDLVARPADTTDWNWQAPCVRWRSPLYMPRWASRITLAVTAVRVERLQALTEADARAEGMPGEGVPARINGELGTAHFFDPVRAFSVAWDRINGKRHGCAWADNPWVWVVSFERVTP